MGLYTIRDRKTGRLLDVEYMDREIVLSPSGYLIEYYTDCGELTTMSVENEFEVVWLGDKPNKNKTKDKEG